MTATSANICQCHSNFWKPSTFADVMPFIFASYFPEGLTPLPNSIDNPNPYMANLPFLIFFDNITPMKYAIDTKIDSWRKVYRKHFHKQQQAEIWVKRKISHKWKNCWVMGIIAARAIHYQWKAGATTSSSTNNLSDMDCPQFTLCECISPPPHHQEINDWN